MPEKLIVLGSDGMLGTALKETFRNSEIYTFNKLQLDITNEKLVFEKIGRIKPSIVINLAAYTDVDGSETNKELAFKVNGEGVKIVAEACSMHKASLMHISTDYVFDGSQESYIETDRTNPINIYGKSKELGEKYLIETLKNYYLIRTSWMFGENGSNFVDAIFKLAKSKSELKVVDDQHGRPTYAKDLSVKMKEIIDAKMPYGIYHVTNSKTCTWYEFAKKIIEIGKINSNVNPMPSRELKRPAKRPKYSVLANTKLTPLRDWQGALKEYLEIRWKV